MAVWLRIGRALPAAHALSDALRLVGGRRWGVFPDRHAAMVSFPLRHRNFNGLQ